MHPSLDFQQLYDLATANEKRWEKSRTQQPASPEPQAIYPEGTCLAVKLYIGGYGAAIVLRHVYRSHDDGDDIYSLIGGLKGAYEKIPSMEVFEKRDWLYLTHHEFTGKIHITWVSNELLNEYLQEAGDTVIVVGHTEILPNDPSADFWQAGVSHSSIGWVENQIWLQNEWDKQNIKS